MTDKNKATECGGQNNKHLHFKLNHNKTNGTTAKPATQLERVLLALLYHKSLNCQEAEKTPVNARHLNSVISELANCHLLNIQREREKVNGYCGKPCYLIRYSVCSEEQLKAQQLVEQWRTKRDAPQIAWHKLREIPLSNLLRTF